jgi:hypothetical protein
MLSILTISGGQTPNFANDFVSYVFLFLGNASDDIVRPGEEKA